MFEALLFAAHMATVEPEFEPVCDDKAALSYRLLTMWQERPILRGLTSGGGHLVEVFWSQRRTWTMLVTRTDGCSFILAAGIDMEIVIPDQEDSL